METLKTLLDRRELIVAPGVYDPISAKLAERAGFPVLYMTGFGTVAAHLGLPDAGLATYTEMVGRVAVIAGAVSVPVIADGDTGYGGLVNLRRTVQGYERAGAAGIQLEDQLFPKKCGHTPGRQVIAADDMADKIRLACDTRQSDEFLIVARTDARTAHGLDEALERAAAYAEAGADILFVESPETEDEMARIASELDRPVLANMVEGGRTPLLGRDRLAALGFAMAIFPVTGLLASAAALERTYRTLAAEGSSAETGLDLYPFAEMTRLMGFEEIWAFEKRWAR